MNELLLLPCSLRKRIGGNNRKNNRIFSKQIKSSEQLQSLIIRIAEYNEFNPFQNESLLPAHKRYDGTIYRELAKSNFWPSLNKKLSPEVLIFSSLYSFVYWDEYIIHYNVSINSKIETITINSFWQNNSIEDFLVEYLEKNKINLVRSFLSKSYTKPFENLISNKQSDIVWLQYSYSPLGISSNVLRAKDLINHVRQKILCPKCESKLVYRANSNTFQCFSCETSFDQISYSKRLLKGNTDLDSFLPK